MFCLSGRWSEDRFQTVFTLSLSVFILALAALSPHKSFAAQVKDKSIPYYGQQFYERAQSGIRDEELIEDLRTILTQGHIASPGSMDKVVGDCGQRSQSFEAGGRGCYSHRSVGYKTARKIVLGELHLVNSGKGYAIEEVYCQRPYTRDDFSSAPYPGPHNLPDNKIINVEHTWPQSRFNSGGDKDLQKSDLHHLFPTDSKMNQIRGNMPFGEVDTPAMNLPCPVAKMGYVKGESGDYFEPPVEHKGNVARALFYFSVRYRLQISRTEEEFLRKWHQLDPVDSEEEARNQRIYEIQGNRNPFIDFPELVERISNF